MSSGHTGAHQSQRISAAVSAYSDRPDRSIRPYPITDSGRRDRLIGAEATSVVCGSVLGLLESLLHPHGWPVEFDEVRVVQDAVADGIGDSRVVQCVMPSFLGICDVMIVEARP